MLWKSKIIETRTTQLRRIDLIRSFSRIWIIPIYNEKVGNFQEVSHVNKNTRIYVHTTVLTELTYYIIASPEYDVHVLLQVPTLGLSSM